MKSEEARTAEAITALSTRLDSWDVSDANSKATEYVRDMVRAGWRPKAHEVWTPPAARPGEQGDYAAGAAQLRELLAEATADLCSHGVRRTHCNAHDEDSAKRQATTGSLREREEAS